MLYIVATPIGNLGEITFRAIEILKQADYILCEDTRTSSVLLDRYAIKTNKVSYHKFNEKEKLEKIITDLKNGGNIALISDAGMPAICDPGNILITSAIENNLAYTVVSGASAFVNAFVLSGYTLPFTFFGFLPAKLKDKKQLLDSVASIESTLIFYMTPHSIEKDIEFLFKKLGNREICVIREISKKFETITFSSLEKGYAGVEKGEFVVVVKKAKQERGSFSEKDILQEVANEIAKGTPKMQAMKNVAGKFDLSKSEVYKILQDAK